MADPLRRTVTALTGLDLPELECAYVETFDSTRRHSLFLTYFAHGDTRKRGMALLRFRQTYRASGYEDSPTELPDHLCVVLEYAATIDPAAGRQLLLDHRAGLEVLRLALSEAGSPWAGAVEAVCATLPAAAGRRDRGDPPARRRGSAGGGGRPGAVRLDRADPAADARRPRARSALMDVFLWVIVPYLCLATFVVGHCWRYRYDKFGWTTRSSQLYEDRLLRIGVPLFHFGMLGVVGGHVIGLLVPESWTDAVGVSTETYHVVAVGGGLLAGVMTAGRAGDPDLPPTHGRAGLLGDHRHGQGDVRVPRRRDRPRHVEHHRRARSSPSAATTTTARACRSGTARSSPSSRSRS